MTDVKLTQVAIETPALTVRVKSRGSLDYAITRALKLWREVWTPELARPGGGSTGFVIERGPEETDA